uniref:26S proteasome non-ATPase regulatory subunit 3 C-terminal domain-containing protein n=1 Tax=Capra hircus TaxID=9925 RepID=A0A8C2P7F6_CAPHI
MFSDLEDGLSGDFSSLWGLQAIRDGVIEASINHEKGYVQSKEMIDIYSTREPQLAFHQRISFCLDIHNMSVKAMRFPPKSYNKDLESAEERREREQQDLEFAKEMAEDDDDSLPRAGSWLVMWAARWEGLALCPPPGSRAPELGHVLGCMFFEASIMIFKQ